MRALLFESLESRQLLAVTPELVRDIQNQVLPRPSNPANFTQVGDTVFFTASTPTYGTELWRTDGTAEGTFLVKDINPGESSSDPSFLINNNGTLFFWADDDVKGNELWKSDGTAAGTVLVKDVTPGTGCFGLCYSDDLFYPKGTYPASQVAFDGHVFAVITQNDETATSLLRSDGTSSSTTILRTDLWQYDERNLAVMNEELFFGTGTGEPQLWKMSSATSEPEAVVVTGEEWSFKGPNDFVVTEERLFFRAGAQLWVSDGTTAGTASIKPLNLPQNFSPFNGNLLFTEQTSGVGRELWISDGTPAGTRLLKDIRVGTGSSAPGDFAVIGNIAYFSANGGGGRELWRTDGTAEGTYRVKDILPGSGSSDPADLVNLNGTLFFSADNGAQGRELWRSDGTAAGTVLHADLNIGEGSSSLVNLTTVGEALYFAASQPSTGAELWKSDGTVPGTKLVIDIATATLGSDPADFAEVNGVVYFVATDPQSGRELWKTDGTANGTVRVKDILPGPGSSSPANLVNVGGTLYFTAYSSTSGRELWKSDGTAAGTGLVRDIRPGAVGSDPQHLVDVNGTLFFTADNGTTGRELWKSNGTAVGTVLVRDISVGESSSSPAGLVSFQGIVYFSALTSALGVELWKSNGTASGTVLVRDISPNRAHSLPQNLTVVGNTLYFTATTAATGRELWKTRGTAQTTSLVKDIRPGSESSSPNELTSFKGELFFAADDGTIGEELWKSNGTATGTVLVRDIQPNYNHPYYGPEYSSNPRGFTSLGNYLVFAAYGNGGSELWRTDGTRAGTIPVKDINPGSDGGYYGSTWNSSGPTNLTRMNGVIFFTAHTEEHGAELWKTDGTREGTRLVADLRTGEQSSFNRLDNPLLLFGASHGLYFVPDLPDTGKELWKIANAPPVVELPAVNLTYTENGPPVFPYSQALVTDPDNPTFSSGQILVRVTNGTPADRLIIRNQGTGPGQVGISGATVTYGGVIVGTVEGGVGNTALAVRFNDAATFHIVRAVLRNVAFASTGQNPPPGQRTLEMRVTDGDGGASATFRSTITVRAVNDAPRIGLRGSTSYVEGAPPRILSTVATVSDVDSPHFGGGNLRIAIASGGRSNDRITILSQGSGPGQISVVQNRVKFGSVVIGTFSGGTGLTPLVISLTVNSTPQAVQALLRRVAFASLGNNVIGGVRTIQISLTERDGVQSNVATKSVNVVPVEENAFSDSDRPVDQFWHAVGSQI